MGEAEAEAEAARIEAEAHAIACGSPLAYAKAAGSLAMRAVDRFVAAAHQKGGGATTTSSRQIGVLARIARAERAADLGDRQRTLLARLARLEASTSSTPASASFSSPAHARIHAALTDLGIPASSFRVARVPSDYYDRDLEARRALINEGASAEGQDDACRDVALLCKTIVMENTKDARVFPDGLPNQPEAPWGPNRCDDDDEASGEYDGWWDGRYFMVVVQYVARLHAEKVRDAICDRRVEKIARKRVKMRLCPTDVSAAITGAEHNAVTPCASKHRVPIILSDAIPKAAAAAAGGGGGEAMLWLGAGEVDLKVGVRPSDFIRAFNPAVIPCTY